jgi:chemotaxis protein CheX
MGEAMYVAAAEVFGTMLNHEPVPHDPLVRPSIELPDAGIVALIGLTGDWVGSVALISSAPCACWMASQFMMSEYPEVNDEALDALGEITNMIVGGFKNNLTPHTGALAMSIPAVVYGRGIRTTTSGSSEWMVFPLSCGTNKFEMVVQLQKRKEQTAGASFREVRVGV